MSSKDNMELTEEKQWFAIHVFTGQEEKIKAFLHEESKRLKIEDQLFQILVPKEEVIEMRDGKKKTKSRVLFPGYLFIEMIRNKATEHLILNTPQVISFGGINNKPTPLQKSEVDRILGQTDRAATARVVEIPFAVGDTIKVIHGPFKDFTGVVRDINNEKRKVKVMVSIFGRSTPIELDFLEVSTELATS